MRRTVPRPKPDRPLTFMDIADGSFEIMRSGPRVVAVAALVFFLPVRMFSTWLQRDVIDALAGVDITTLNAETGTFEGSEGIAAIGTLDAVTEVGFWLLLIPLPFLGVVLAHLMLGWIRGEERTVWECLRFTGARAHRILAAFFLCKLLQIIGMVVFMIPFFVATVGLSLVAPVLAAEDVGPVTAIRRSWELVRSNFARALGVVVVTVVVTELLDSAFSSVPVALAFVFGRWASLVFVVVNTISNMVITTFTVGVSVMLYFDLTTRREGRDISDRVALLETSQGLGAA